MDIFHLYLELKECSCCLVGVSISDWQAKEGECEEKCEGAAGPFEIVRTCEPKDSNQCKNVTLTDTSKDCPTYCSSNAGRIEYMIYLISGGGYSHKFRMGLCRESS